MQINLAIKNKLKQSIQLQLLLSHMYMYIQLQSMVSYMYIPGSASSRDSFAFIMLSLSSFRRANLPSYTVKLVRAVSGRSSPYTSHDSHMTQLHVHIHVILYV